MMSPLIPRPAGLVAAQRAMFAPVAANDDHEPAIMQTSIVQPITQSTVFPANSPEASVGNRSG
jgi:hypothetical protein